MTEQIGGPVNQSVPPAKTTATESATVAFIDLAGFSAITDVYGDPAAIAMLELFEGMVAGAGPGLDRPGVQDARALLDLPARVSRWTLVLLATLRGSLCPLARNLCRAC